METVRAKGRRRPMAEINVVPYIDVMLVLLIIFMVTAPLLTQGIDVDLPKVGAGPLDLPPQPAGGEVRLRLLDELHRRFAPGDPLLETLPQRGQPARQRPVGLREGDALDIDLSHVERSDSAGLALLVECLRHARQSGKTIRFFNIPAQMLAIARVSGLDEVLPLQRD